MSGWQLSGDAPTAYTRFALKIMEPWTDDLIRSAGCRDGDQVLDVACGTGVVANRVSPASGRLCAVTGVDVNAGMLNVARRNTNIEWKEASATNLPFDDGRFDVILCQQGLQYFPDRAAAMREMARVLVSGGRIALNVWGILDRQPFHAALVDTVAAFLGKDRRTAFEMAFSLNNAGELRQLAEDAGLRNIHVRYEHRTVRHPAPALFVAGFMGATPFTEQFLTLSDDKRHAFVAHATELLASYVDDAGLAFPMENHILTATKPA